MNLLSIKILFKYHRIFYRVMPARLKDKLVSHILVLCLFLEEFSLELTNLQTDLNKTNEK